LSNDRIGAAIYLPPRVFGFFRSVFLSLAANRARPAQPDEDCFVLKAFPALDCEFTLALNNRTGKYFFCKDMIDASQDLIRNCYYWRIPLKNLPPKTIARVLGRLARIEVDLRVRSYLPHIGLAPISHPRPMVFTDPRECVLYNLKSNDVVLCHDMGPITHPSLYEPGVRELYTLAFDMIKAARPFMLFVSEASRRDFVTSCGSEFPLLQVVYPPIRSGMERSDEKAVPHIPSKFLLTVGSIGARKNQLRSIQAFDVSGLAKEGYAYVICGGPEPGAEPVITLARATPGVILPGYVNDDQLRWLYKKAQGFILPSLLEGFGLPAAEAINYDLVPVLSSGGALEEVAGSAAVFVNPLDVADIAAGMRKIAAMTGEERARRLSQLQLSVTRFSLEKAVAAWRWALMRAIAC
jgi:glycosyltransferase involved in cell wall biosynthesis